MIVFLGALLGAWGGWTLWHRATRPRAPWIGLSRAAILDHVEAMLADTGAITSVRGLDGCDLWALVGDVWGAVWVVTAPGWTWDAVAPGWDREYPTWRRGRYPGPTAPPSWGLVVALAPVPPAPPWASGVLQWNAQTAAGLWADTPTTKEGWR